MNSVYFTASAGVAAVDGTGDSKRDLGTRLRDRRGKELRIVADSRIELEHGELPARGLEVELRLFDRSGIDCHVATVSCAKGTSPSLSATKRSGPAT
jgi:hypothetical protein